MYKRTGPPDETLQAVAPFLKHPDRHKDPTHTLQHKAKRNKSVKMDGPPDER